jgi:hypothetical protein
MGRLKVTYAPPGTDPTRMPSDPPKIGSWHAIKDNWMLLVGVAAMILFAPRVLGFQIFGGAEGYPEIQPTATATAAVVEDSGLVLPDGWCEHAGQPVRPGEYFIGSDYKECKGGAWHELDVGLQTQDEAD